MLFSEVLLEQGVDVELPLSMEDVLGILDDEIPNIPVESKSYRIASVNRASIGKEWVIMINVEESDGTESEVAVIKLNAIADEKILFSVPPRHNQTGYGLDPRGALYGRMIFSLLNTFQSRGLLDLPGRLPIE
ncbi:MAG: hypothetical protein FI721_02410 [SAR202 cluster bacterium]|nr:hypothetical protein [Chloroflexota bacterium]MQG18024.1 hypothetical protein [SAR202 cluster bacterium]MQG35589.1 hypothetical protein [SAR202 cluster bacterium]MQG86523.1 hypothetical protein [SAR202 cluster bacterium]|tara:strand:+ start:12264 stop:12662 length:399 start_codon:yes stop_codon:yes gene_type:complete